MPLPPVTQDMPVMPSVPAPAFEEVSGEVDAASSSDDKVVSKKPSTKPAESDSIKVLSPKKGKGIEVEAVRPGYFQCSRKVVGDRFVVSDESKLGSWMKCMDPAMEKEHQKMMQAKKENEAGK